MTTKDLKEEKEQEQFLARWSRLKQEAQDQPPQEKAPEKAVDPKAPPPELPPVDKLTFNSDYRAFFHPKVSEDARRAALKKLFSDPHFNVMDGLDVYIDDYSKSEPIPAAMLASLRQAQNILKWAKGDGDEKKKDAPAELAVEQESAQLDERTASLVPATTQGESLAKGEAATPDTPKPSDSAG